MSGTRNKAVLVAVRLPDVTESELASSLKELRHLIKTLGYEVVAEVTQARTHLDPGAVLGEGKLRELAALTGGSGESRSTPARKMNKARMKLETRELARREHAENPDCDVESSGIDLCAVDHELTPSQARNLERAAGVAVLDRTGVIIEIFHRHAHSREARLQVEIARLRYTAPRLRESPSGKERQRGRGAGEAALELDRRRIRDRIAELQEELDAIQREQANRRVNRREARRVALVGYTNAGKSSLMRALTGSEVHVEDKLFATLDTTVRALRPETRPRILVSDTVGFIKKLPHDLVASFKSTLDEALQASLLLHLADAADPAFEAQLEVTRRVLAEIGADRVPSILVLNKADKLAESERSELAERHPDAWLISAHDPSDATRVRSGIIDHFEATYLEAELFVPWAEQRMVSEMHECGRIVEQSYTESGVNVKIRTDAETLARLRSQLARS